MPERLEPTNEGIRRAAAYLAEGQLVAFPTETVYGLGADATNSLAIRRVYEAKGRPSHNPLIVHVPDAEAARRWAAQWPRGAELLAAHFWPGPLTLVVPAADGLAPAALANGTTVGLRAPDHPVALALLRASGLPLAAPSANASGTLSPVCAEHVLSSLGDSLAAVLDGGRCRVGIESTVVDCTGDVPRILRPGIIGRDAIERVLGLDVPQPEINAGRRVRPLLSPGLMDRHYAPRIPLRVVSREQLAEAPTTARRVFLAEGTVNPRETDHVLPADSVEFAGQLYAVLWELQDSGAAEIWMEKLPASEEWAALRDRLRRASTPP
ncbi:MAG: L-threonylcarbamoyladenylate synthase [Candidatus Sumerlaeota bacterium]|nr:L-threonylcarbamoyladenylate synthase [Candidatus Sumerlaeota bacterium]